MAKKLENNNHDTKEIEVWYDNEFKIFEILATKITSLIKEIIEYKDIKYHSITHRIKDKSSLLNKIKSKKYEDPISQIHDYIGIRIVTFVKSDVEKVCKEIEGLFEIDTENSSNKSEELGEDKVGYRSIHYVAKIDDKRAKMPEYAHLKDKCFEIQVRTILEHAWADISHDRTYKFNKILPEKNDIRRRFALASASLEMVDREFDRLSKEIEEYSFEVSEETEKGNLEYLIDSTSLLIYLKEKFKDEIDKKMISPSFNDKDEIIIEELNNLGIHRLEQLEEKIDDLFKQKYLGYVKYLNENNHIPNFLGILRHFMVINYGDLYFEKSWGDGKWGGMKHQDALKLFEIYPDVEKVMDDSPISFY
ncbi:GTP pyrophosphokinase [Exiguobacterium undae]|uniref:RelA/SpoT domain-containing protein n=1 Tax=Exiguobacterium undae TaxID=169177 RepID=A0ABX2V4T3_9BACL|nr:RelA/SpoT domain-containing protein [Exiguobacterium undae]OAN10087.1 hypothetical protein A3783_15050 [Exiguobacterium undae]